MAKRTVFAADENNEKPMLKCVQLRVTQDGLRAAGSDGTCVVTVRGNDKSTGNFSVLIPAPSLSRLAQRKDSVMPSKDNCTFPSGSTQDTLSRALRSSATSVSTVN